MASKVTNGGELMFPSKYLKAADLKGKEYTLTVSAVKHEQLPTRGGKMKDEWLISFKEAKKQFVCNVTNAESISVEHGLESKNWIGKRVTLYPTRVQFGRDMVDAIRVRERTRNHSSEQAGPALDEEPVPYPELDEIPTGSEVM